MIVPKGYSGGFSNLYGPGLCHPGLRPTQRWNDYVLKYFEQKVVNKSGECRTKMSQAENDIIELRNRFKQACRPGEWVSDDDFDKELSTKKKIFFKQNFNVIIFHPNDLFFLFIINFQKKSIHNYVNCATIKKSVNITMTKVTVT